MQVVLVLCRLIFVALIYIFLFRVASILLADLNRHGFFCRRETDYGRLEVLTGIDTFPKGRVFKIDSKGLRLGRSKQNDVVLPDHYASLEHAVIKHQKGVTILEDRDSTNGTWVNGEKISSPVQLVPGDYVKIGSITFQYSRWQNESSKF